MGRRCGCAGGDCSCAITRGQGVEFQGDGSQTTPLVISTNTDVHAYLQGRSTSNVNVNVTGSGIAGDPYSVSVNFVASQNPILRVAEYLTAGTYEWIRPPGVAMVDVYCIGGGASGEAGGSSYGNTANAPGGRGGSGGAWSKARIVLPTEVTRAVVVVGAGAGAVQPVPGSTYRVASSPGSPSSVRFWVDVDGTATATDILVRAQGGQIDPTLVSDTPPSVGTRPGQVHNQSLALPLFDGPGAAAGGAGSPSKFEEASQNGRPGGQHSWHTLGTPLYVGGPGGRGGNGGLPAQHGQAGATGIAPGGGGGGGGGRGWNQTESGLTPRLGGAGGPGGQGAVWIVSL